MIIKTAPPPAAVPTMIMGSGVEVCKEEVHPCVGSQVETEVLAIVPGAVPVSVAVGVMVILMVMAIVAYIVVWLVGGPV